jgi:hypothetical protein
LIAWAGLRSDGSTGAVAGQHCSKIGNLSVKAGFLKLGEALGDVSTVVNPAVLSL